MGNDDGRLHTMDIFFQALQDTMLAVQNVINAAESMGLGIVPLGTVNDDPKAMLKVLDLPELTYPALGLQVGVPDQEPQLKPRLPLEFTTFENEYPRDFEVSELKDYDEIVQTYYDLRDANRRIEGIHFLVWMKIPCQIFYTKKRTFAVPSLYNQFTTKIMKEG